LATPSWSICESCASSQSTCSSSETRIDRSSSSLPWSLRSRAELDRVVVAGDRLALELEVEAELLGHGLADVHLVEALHVGDALEVQDALDELVRVLHLVDRLLLHVVGEAVVAPVAAHLRVDEILVDRRQLSGENLVERVDDRLLALHGFHCSSRGSSSGVQVVPERPHRKGA
jgi:hypothetical protein